MLPLECRADVLEDFVTTQLSVIDLTVDGERGIELNAHVDSTVAVHAQDVILALHVVRVLKAHVDAFLDVIDWQFESLHNFGSALICDHVFCLKARVVNIEQVIEDMLHVYLVRCICEHVINAALPQVLCDKLLSGDVRILFQLFFAGRLEAEDAVADAVLFFYFVGAAWALESDDARDKECTLSESMLVFVHLLKHPFVQIKQAAVVKRVADSLRIFVRDLNLGH